MLELPVSAVLVTNGRNPMLLNHVVQQWQQVGCEVVCVGAVDSVDTHANGSRRALTTIATAAGPLDYGSNFELGRARATRPNIVHAADDVLPCGGDWGAALATPANAIVALRLTSVVGQRWGDWATFDGETIRNQPYDQHGKGTFIAGNAMLMGENAGRLLSWHGRSWHAGDDILACWGAARAGAMLLAPVPHGPELAHLDRLPPSPADPDRLGVDLLSGAAVGRTRARTVLVGGYSLLCREGTWDLDIAREVIDCDFYLLRLWQPNRPPRFIVDVGAHIGAFCVLAAGMFPTATVLASEACSDNALLAHLNTWDLAKVDLRHQAIASSRGVAFAPTNGGANTGGRAIRRTAEPTEAVAAVSTSTLEDRLQAAGADKVDLLKLDCEGAEWDILPQFLATGATPVDMIAMELHELPKPGHDCGAMEAMLKRRFEVVHVRTTGSPQLWRIHAMGWRSSFG